VAKRRPPQEVIREITVPFDGIEPVRRAQPWARNKLGILAAYLSRYATACASAPHGFNFVDALSGPGLCRIDGENECLLGSTLIALRASPPFSKCLAMDLNEANVQALRQRTASYVGRVAVEHGDCNVHLQSAMEEHIPKNSPVFVLLDPEGAELHWKTVQTAAMHRAGQLKSELLILLATSFLDRMLPGSGDIELHNEMALNLVFPPSRNWRDTWGRKRAGEITSEQGRTEHAQNYCGWLENTIGYKYVETRAVTRPHSTASVYHLIFASDHSAGRDIMAYVFANMYPNEPNLRLPGFLD
jgi:three-Cys-motif partner protein